MDGPVRHREGWDNLKQSTARSVYSHLFAGNRESNFSTCSLSCNVGKYAIVSIPQAVWSEVIVDRTALNLFHWTKGRLAASGKHFVKYIVGWLVAKSGLAQDESPYSRKLEADQVQQM